MQDRELIAHQSVRELHQWIEKVFIGRSGYPAALESLLDSFSPAFSMVTIKGQNLKLAEVELMFRNNIGGQSHLAIEIEACETLQLSESSVVCRYCETHRNENVVQSRWSVVIIDIVNGKPFWRYLHETVVAN